MKMVAMKLGNTPRPAAWSPPLASFPPSVLILTTSSQLSPSSCGGGFLVNGVGRMIGCSSRRRRELLIDGGATRLKGGPNRHKNPLGRSDWAGRSMPFLGRFGPVFLPTAHLDILDLAPLICVILRSSSPRSR
jgi:hypothetical protein